MLLEVKYEDVIIGINPQYCGADENCHVPDEIKERYGCAACRPKLKTKKEFKVERYSKKPVVVEAVQYNGSNGLDIENWLDRKVLESPVLETTDYNPSGKYLQVKTLEGTMTAIVGDYIIKGVKGEFYPCKPDVFEMSYQKESGSSKEMVEVKNPLFTQKYTVVYAEKDYKYNAPHLYHVISEQSGEILGAVHFQEGPIRETRVNGVMNEDLLLMVLERLNCFQNSEFKCRENALAITKIEEAVMWLRKRTMGREEKGIEGTHKVG
ncbi:MAG: hypothetical protein LBR69_03100 [Endomicrobium sp.]|jgi:hypothetical protein|nr:hypothetical protein [Endomicrobium sp.]